MARPLRHNFHILLIAENIKLDRSNPRVANPRSVNALKFPPRDDNLRGRRRRKNGQIVGVYIHDPLARINESDG